MICEEKFVVCGGEPPCGAFYYPFGRIRVQRKNDLRLPSGADVGREDVLLDLRERGGGGKILRGALRGLSKVDLSQMPEQNGQANMPIDGAAVRACDGESIAVWMNDSWVRFELREQ